MTYLYHIYAILYPNISLDEKRTQLAYCGHICRTGRNRYRRSRVSGNCKFLPRHLAAMARIDIP